MVSDVMFLKLDTGVLNLSMMYNIHYTQRILTKVALKWRRNMIYIVYHISTPFQCHFSYNTWLWIEWTYSFIDNKIRNSGWLHYSFKCFLLEEYITLYSCFKHLYQPKLAMSWWSFSQVQGCLLGNRRPSLRHFRRIPLQLPGKLFIRLSEDNLIDWLLQRDRNQLALREFWSDLYQGCWHIHRKRSQSSTCSGCQSNSEQLHPRRWRRLHVQWWKSLFQRNFLHRHFR